ncbi:spermatogenesis-associated protein 6-like isoform X1 [Orbicella faveolata]|uniref:spermatogenesis-associated protein 6-like isoform X1 n=1 Tax=Orbicella faveolata TaxID=48498 RepID=UPI0009E47FCC|nr:spermatogenesis-associated protein 6-like isoform X1 [Orbicella faveolata]
MPRKAMKVVVELDIHTVTCPGTFLRDYGYVYLKVNCMGLEVNTKSVAPTFPLFFHERLRFERVFKSCQDPAYVTVHLKGEDVLVELRQHDDYISDGYVIGHYANNARDFLYPAVPPYPGSGREVTLFKTSLFNPIRITGQPLRLEFSTKTTIKEVPDPLDYVSSDSGVDDLLTNSTFSTSRRSISPLGSKHMSRSPSPSRRKLTSTPRPDDTVVNHKKPFLVRHKDNSLLENRDFSSFARPKPRRTRSKSPTRRPRSTSPSRLGTSSVLPLPAWKYSEDFPSSSTTRHKAHSRSATAPMSLSQSYRPSSPSRSLSYALDDLNISTNSWKNFSDPVLRFKSRYSPNLRAALGASDRIQQRVEKVIEGKSPRKFSEDSDNESVDSLDVLRESLREERRALSDAIREADRAAYYKSLGIDL